MNTPKLRKVTETNWSSLIAGIVMLLLSLFCGYAFTVIAFNLDWPFSDKIVRSVPTATTAVLAFCTTIVPAIFAFQHSRSERTQWC